jgi:hypothetical protein
MFRQPRKRTHELRDDPRGESLPKPLDYQRGEDRERRKRFWPDRQGWIDLTWTAVAEWIFVPLLTAGVVWLCFRYFRNR